MERRCTSSRKIIARLARRDRGRLDCGEHLTQVHLGVILGSRERLVHGGGDRAQIDPILKPELRRGTLHSGARDNLGDLLQPPTSRTGGWLDADLRGAGLVGEARGESGRRYDGPVGEVDLKRPR